MNQRQKKIVSIAAGIANLSFALVVAGTATYAWFRENRTVYADGMSVQCNVPESRLSWEILRYDDDLKAGISSTNNVDFYLDPYDQYIKSRNIHSNCILRAVMTFDDGALLDPNQQLYVDISCNDATVYDDSNHVRSYTSNISQFKSTVSSYYTEADPTTPVVVNGAIDESTPNTRYQTVTNYFAAQNASTPFLTVNNQTPNKDRDNKITLIPTFDCSTYVKQLVIYIECSYKSNLVDFYLNSWGTSLTGEIELSGDISLFNFRIGTKYTGAYVKVTSDSQLTTGDYLIGYDAHNAAMDGSLDKDTMDTACNYIPVTSKKGRISNTETTYNSRYTYNTDTNLLTSASGYNIGRTTDSSGGSILVNTSTSNTNTISQSGSNTDVVSSAGSHLRYNTTKNQTRFRYFYSGSYTNQEAINLYKYDASASADVDLTSIAVSGNYTKTFYVGDTFAFGDGVITATYSDGTSSSISASECVFTGYDMNAATSQVVTVTYTEDGITKSTTYNITVKHEPYVTIDYTVLKGLVGNSATITATAHDFSGAVTWTWTSSDTSKVTVTPDSSDSSKCVLGYVAVTDSPVTITVTGTYSAGEESAQATSSVTVVSGGTGNYVLVTSENQLSAGDSVVFACTTDSYNMTAGTWTSTTKYLLGCSSTFSSDKSTITSLGTNTIEFALGGVSGAWTFANSSGDLLGAAAAKNLQFGDSSSTTTWTISISSNDATIESTNSSYGSIQFNYPTGDTAIPRFLNYTSSQKAIQLYKKEGGTPAKSLARIEVSDAKTSYFTDDTFVTPTVTAYYDDATSADVSNSATFSGYNIATAGSQNVSVSYTEGGVTAETTYIIIVTQSDLTDISISGYTTQFYVGDSFEFGGTCTATFTSGKTKTVTPTQFTGYDMNTAGTQTVTVTYSEGGVSKTATYTITVTELTLTGLSVTAAPTKTTYNVGDTFDNTGAKITASFNNGVRTRLVDATYDKTSPLTTADTKVTYSYTYNGVTKTCEQAIVVNAASVSFTLAGVSVTSLSGVAETTLSNLVISVSGFSGTVTYTWSSGDATKATPTATSGNTTNVNLLTAGTTTIQCVATDGTQTVTGSIPVTIQAITVAISEETATVMAGDTVTLTGTSNSTITWTSSDTSKATVASDGTVTGVAAGTVTITATAGTGSNQVSDTCIVTVTAVHTVTIVLDSSSITVGNTATATTECDQGDTVTWSIQSGSSYITLSSTTASDITITGTAAGTATIRATCASGAYAEETITVNSSTTEQVFKTLDFSTSTNTGISSYTSSSTATVGSDIYTIYKGNNNNNGWSYYKFGSKSAASVGLIASPNFNSVAITKVVITISAVTSSSINSISICGSNTTPSASSYGTSLVSKTSSFSTGDLTLTISSPTNYNYYTVAISCAKGSSNGLISITKVVYYYMA